MPNIPSGTVQVNDNGFSIGQVTLDGTGTGVLTYTPTESDVPSDALVGSYSGDSNDNPATGTLTLPIQDPAKATPTVTITANPNPGIVGSPVTLTIVVANS